MSRARIEWERQSVLSRGVTVDCVVCITETRAYGAGRSTSYGAGRSTPRTIMLPATMAITCLPSHACHHHWARGEQAPDLPRGFHVLDCMQGNCITITTMPTDTCTTTELKNFTQGMQHIIGSTQSMYTGHAPKVLFHLSGPWAPSRGPLVVAP